MKEAFETLRTMLKKHAGRMIVTADTPKLCSIDAGYSERWKKNVFFGAVRLGKSYVSYHLIPVYACPDLVAGLSPELKKRMQGKSCFNFKSVSAGQEKQLSKLTQQAVERFKKVGQFSNLSSVEIHHALFKRAPRPRTSEQLKRGIRKHMRRRYARR